MEAEVLQPEIEPAFVFRMREMLPADLDAAEDKLGKATSPVSVVGHRESGMYDVYRVASGDREYRVVRLGYFASCDCGDFKFSGTGCKHLPICFPQVCRKCFERPVEQRGTKCSRCAVEDAPYLSPSVEQKAERIGGIRI